jgi:hypothetical protein
MEDWTVKFEKEQLESSRQDFLFSRFIVICKQGFFLITVFSSENIDPNEAKLGLYGLMGKYKAQ